MKLFHLNPNSYGQEYFVIAENAELAKVAILDYLKRKSVDEKEYHTDFYKDQYDFLNKHFIKDKLPDEYTLDEYEPGEVIRSEIC